MLQIVSTPIGNLKDITYRAVEALKSADIIVAEDSRRLSILMKEYDIGYKEIIVYNEHNEKAKTGLLISLLKQGKNIALTTDSGTPCISDPGFLLVREAVKEGIQIVPVPGASALIAALSCSGLPCDRFMFYGFAPKKPGQKKKFFEDIKKEEKTAAFYESPYRIIKTLAVMNEVIPEKNVVIARELTKKFEEFIRGKVKDVYEKLKQKELKGEMVVVVN
jgi:16S rRNA (cytidine1402-2'-O)-methyltransferase